MELAYPRVVEEIKALEWESLNEPELLSLMYLSLVTAREFADAVRVTLALYPEDEQIQEMARGELDTDNLHYLDYSQCADHAQFLEHFLGNFFPNPALSSAANTYSETCTGFSNRVRAMTIFSRERELQGIFENILGNPLLCSSDDLRLKAYAYYLRRHLALDGCEGGHESLLESHVVSDAVRPFYETRLALYKALPSFSDK